MLSETFYSATKLSDLHFFKIGKGFYSRGLGVDTSETHSLCYSPEKPVL